MLGFEIRMHGRMVAAAALALPGHGGARARAGHARRGVHAAGRHAVDQGGRDDLRRLHVPVEPEDQGCDGNEVSGNAFNVSRTYINITGNISHRIAFRITPDITRETGTGSSLNGSYTFRLKYAFAQFNLDDWMTRDRGSASACSRPPRSTSWRGSTATGSRAPTFDGPRGVPVAPRTRGAPSTQLFRQLRRRPRRHLQRRDVLEAGSERQEGVR